jgi:hypothetical protein
MLLFVRNPRTAKVYAAGEPFDKPDLKEHWEKPKPTNREKEPPITNSKSSELRRMYVLSLYVFLQKRRDLSFRPACLTGPMGPDHHSPPFAAWSVKGGDRLRG